MNCHCQDDNDIVVKPGQSEYIPSPGFYDHAYPNFCDCLWSFTSPPQCKLTVSALHFSLQSGQDFLTAYNVYGGHPRTTLSQIASCTGDSCDVIKTNSNRLALVFFSDYTGHANGFYLKVQTVDCSKCDVDPCMHGGTCCSDGDDRKCTCPPGYSGLSCEALTNVCLVYGYRCENGGTCTASTERPCTCAHGYDGKFCSVDETTTSTSTTKAATTSSTTSTSTSTSSTSTSLTSTSTPTTYTSKTSSYTASESTTSQTTTRPSSTTPWTKSSSTDLQPTLFQSATPLSSTRSSSPSLSTSLQTSASSSSTPGPKSTAYLKTTTIAATPKTSKSVTLSNTTSTASGATQTTNESRSTTAELVRSPSASHTAQALEISLSVLVLAILIGAGCFWCFWCRSKRTRDQRGAGSGHFHPPDPLAKDFDETPTKDLADPPAKYFAEPHVKNIVPASEAGSSNSGYEVPLGRRRNTDVSDYAEIDYAEMKPPIPPPIELMPKHKPRHIPSTITPRVLSWGFREADNGIVPDCARSHRPLTGYTDALPNTMFTPSEIEDATREAQDSSRLSDFSAADTATASEADTEFTETHM